MRLLIRLVGLLVLGAAFAAMIVDGTRSIAAGSIAILPLGRTLSMLSPDGWPKVAAFVESSLPVLWDPAITTVLQWPVWLVLGVVGFVIMASTRRRVPKIGHRRR